MGKFQERGDTQWKQVRPLEPFCSQRRKNCHELISMFDNPIKSFFYFLVSVIVNYLLSNYLSIDLLLHPPSLLSSSLSLFSLSVGEIFLNLLVCQDSTNVKDGACIISGRAGMNAADCKLFGTCRLTQLNLT